MYERPPVTTVDALRFCVLIVSFSLFTLSSARLAHADPSVIIEIPDRPVGKDTGEDQTPPGDIQAVEEAPPAPPQDLYIVEALTQHLDTPALHKGQHPDDVKAVKTFYKEWSGPALWLTSAGFTPKGLLILEVFGRSDDWGLEPTLFRVPPPAYRPVTPEDQAKTELAISLAALKYVRAAQGGLGDPKAASVIYDVVPKVQAPEMVMKEIAGTQAPERVLTRYHPKHEQFERLRQALPKAKSEAEDIRLRRNMDRWRWMPATLEPSYVWVNIPAFTVDVIEDGKTVQSEKAVVGAIKTPTPVLRAEMTEIVLNPEDVVPLSVIRRHVLPKLRSSGSIFGTSSTAVLEKYKLIVKRNGQAVDPKTIDWKKVNPSTLTFVRKDGRARFSDKVQFMFPNDRKLMMRDATVQAQLAREMRAEGAKDPKVANAQKLAARILAKSNDLSETKASQLASSAKTSKIKLAKPVPIYMTYFTAVVDDQGTVQTLEDVYKLDELSVPVGSLSAPLGQTSAPASGNVPVPPRKPANGSRSNGSLSNGSLATSTP